MHFHRLGMTPLLFILWGVSVIILCVLQYVGISLNLYALWAPLYDKMMHWLGGIMVSTLGMAILSRKVNLLESSNWHITLFALTFAFLGEIVWEINQAIGTLPHFTQKITSLDTLLDIFFSTLGGLVGAGNVRRIKYMLLEEQTKGEQRKKVENQKN